MRNFGMFLFFITALFIKVIKEKNHPICGRYNAESTKIAEFNEPIRQGEKTLMRFSPTFKPRKQTRKELF